MDSGQSRARYFLLWVNLRTNPVDRVAPVLIEPVGSGLRTDRFAATELCPRHCLRAALSSTRRELIKADACGGVVAVPRRGLVGLDGASKVPVHQLGVDEHLHLADRRGGSHVTGDDGHHGGFQTHHAEKGAACAAFNGLAEAAGCHAADQVKRGQERRLRR